MITPHRTPCRRFKFNLGQVVATPGSLEAMERNDQSAVPFLLRHQSGDWGEVDAEDRQTNDQAIAHEGDPDKQQRVLSVYRLKDGTKIWVITEWDRSVTTILLPDEY